MKIEKLDDGRTKMLCRGLVESLRVEQLPVDIQGVEVATSVHGGATLVADVVCNWSVAYIILPSATPIALISALQRLIEGDHWQLGVREAAADILRGISHVHQIFAGLQSIVDYEDPREQARR